MKSVALEARIEHEIRLACGADEAFAYFARNDELLREFLGRDHVERLADGTYRVAVHPPGALGVSLRPCFDVAFLDHPPDRIEMRSLRATLHEGSPHRPDDFDAAFDGEALFRPTAQGCAVACTAHVRVTFGLPGWIAPLVPVPVFESVANGLVRTGMLALATRLGPLLERGIARARHAPPRQVS